MELKGIFMSIVITKAEIDRRGKTQFLRVEGTVQVLSHEDTVEVIFKGEEGFNPNIPLVEVKVIPSDGPMKGQAMPFVMPPKMLSGTETWSEVQVICGDDSATAPLTILTWGEDNRSITSLIGSSARIYKTGDGLTDDFVPDRTNIELSETSKIVRIWFG